MNAIFIHSSFVGYRQTLPYAAGVTHYVDSEVGRLGTVLLHRPGPELARLTPRNNDSLLFDAIPWVGRAQEEHDAFAAALRERGVEVLYLADPAGRDAGRPRRPGRTHRGGAALAAGSATRCAPRVADHLAYLDPAALADVLIAGLAHEELRISSGTAGRAGLHADGPARLRHRPAAQPALHPRLVGLDRRPGRRSPASPCRPAAGRPRSPTRSTATTRASPAPSSSTDPHLEHLEGGDVLLLAPGVLAVGVGERTTPGRRGAARPGRSSPPGWRTPSWWCRSPRSGPPCTSTRSARWSTSTPC